MSAPRLIDAATGRVLLPRLELATTLWRRFRGWQFRRLPPSGCGILIAPCSSVHTCWMRFAIDVAFLDTRGTVIQLAADVRPWRAVWKVRGAIAVLETPSGRCPLTAGMRLKIASDGAALPVVLKSWAS